MPLGLGLHEGPSWACDPCLLPLAPQKPRRHPAYTTFRLLPRHTAHSCPGLSETPDLSKMQTPPVHKASLPRLTAPTAAPSLGTHTAEVKPEAGGRDSLPGATPTVRSGPQRGHPSQAARRSEVGQTEMGEQAGPGPAVCREAGAGQESWRAGWGGTACASVLREGPGRGLPMDTAAQSEAGPAWEGHLPPEPQAPPWERNTAI